ncbi:hypothetical protein NCCP2716_26100 [Sporosarcina sp. NCCP-2716]|uniref:DUF5694 domain-containing protein n=1 Tax=Sporosarcina sp. NCCP-2716 TaxID=2943679 RepID=UPI0020409370|nr:DUF5694 domain-containing protein [Sporosarcina sp. NCCP-2716]GKV70112.1 hypothetical protein NCCP2716_26100 [Sporosarcina sp. NCCP-2716]
MKPKVLVIGVYHFGETTDLTKVEPKSMEEFTSESHEVVQVLSRFNPTRLAVEAVPENSVMLNERYAAYLAGDVLLEKNEIDLVGFPLAKQAAIQEISCVDWMGDISDYAELGDVLQYAEEHEPERYQHLMRHYIEPMQQEASEMVNLTVLDAFRRLNHPKVVRDMHEVYMEFTMIGKEKNYYATDWLTWWYKRNLIIYTNMRRLITSPQDRVLLLIGSGHVHLVKQFLRESGVCDVVDAGEVLN